MASLNKSKKNVILCSVCKLAGHRANSKKFHPDYIPKKDVKAIVKDKIDMAKSEGLSKRLIQMNEDGRHLTDDSCHSEATLTEAMCEVVAYTKELFTSIGATIEQVKTISLYECQEYFHKVGGPEPNPENRKVYMKPDGGILMMIKDDKRIPILIVEDKVQGTNDTLFQEGKKRQATGNAIERGAKNIRGAEMIFANDTIFPYVIFASGCDFHSSETISKRIEMMNMGVPNHYIEITSSTTKEMIDSKIDTIIPSISIKKVCNKSIASVFVKAHKYNEMKHGSSLWKKDEVVKICKKIVDKVFESISI